MVNIPDVQVIAVEAKIDRAMALAAMDEDQQLQLTVYELTKRIGLALVNRFLNNLTRTVEDRYISYKLEIGVVDLQHVPDEALNRTPHEQLLVELTHWEPMRTWKWRPEVNADGVEFLYRHSGSSKFSVSTQMQIWEAVLPNTATLPTRSDTDPAAPIPVEKREIYPVAWRMKAQ